MIRFARATDHAAIAELVEAAFAQPDEARLVERLRTGGDMLFELVSEDAGEISGHILFSRLWADSQNLYAALAPLAVRPGLQRTGIGSALTRASLVQAREFGVHGAIVLGHPDYYPRFGFSAETAANVRSVYAGGPAYMALALEPGAFEAPISVSYADAFSD
ncbi:MAG: N-acetyltransferase [Alphaproteobacteria bacterium]|nr:N-acetyltransferase [Alphaproteobacteria bacterium]MBU1513454.1 N-acetyltransferase [Alphaproteobacteria bacterium]MBU2096446.1 N-acetyltransferase [Alphaproteobacteria bacterium]MBU2149862.1 N-acetyltransferase [Alphaproteobacteria bacterium]MBU2308232.1 N-acetyltransferase [Alphaproteobacteria bacterium]